MRARAFRLWPRTLAAQLIVVMGAAVLVSNAAVAVWFGLGQQQLTESSVIERVLDRAVSASTLLASIPSKQRPTGAHALTTTLLSFQIHRGKAPSWEMTDAERTLASRIDAMLPKGKSARLALVKLRKPTAEEMKRERTPSSVIEMMIPLVRGTQLLITFFHPPPAPWPIQTIAAAAAAILLTSIAAGLVAQRVAKPLSKLAAAATEVARGGKAPRLPVEGPEDVRRAATAFNAMIDQVSRTMQSQRQLLSAVGHDLRTPITAMRINTEFVEDTETRERLEKNIEELQELTEAVLSAAKGVGWEDIRRIDLSALVESLCTDMEEMGAPVTWNGHEAAAPLACRPNEIRRAIRNLIENAVAYGHKADVRLAGNDHAYEVVVSDSGPGIPDADRDRVFEPFVRLESSRCTETGGTGLGLTLVKAIVQGHGGTIRLENRTEGGLAARVSLPREVALA
ncbi:MAG TPA: ATP-binding protein [Rhizomicrobium sp.]